MKLGPKDSTDEATATVHQILQSSPELAVAALDSGWRLVYCNRAAAQMVATGVDKLLGKRLEELQLERHCDAARISEVAKAITCHGRWEGDVERTGPDGARRVCHATVSVMRDQAGEVSGYVFIGRDVTRQKLAEVRLRELSRAVEQSPAMVMITDVEGRIEYVNPRFTEVTGYSADEVLGRNPRLLGSGRQPREFYEQLWKTITAGRDWRGEFCNKKKNGQLYWELASICPIRDEAGRVTHFVAIKEDITQRKQLEDQLRQLSARLAVIEERERRRLAADVHDRIGQWLAVCKMKLGAARAAGDQNETSRLLQEASELLQQAIQETRLLAFELCPPILHELGLEAALEWQAEQFEQRYRVPVRYQDDGQPKPLSEDARATLFRVVGELLANVARHAQARQVQLATRRQGAWLQIEVADDGCGFDPEALPPANPTDGGFGLFHVRQRAADLNGEVQIQSKPGGGTRVMVTVPLRNEE